MRTIPNFLPPCGPNSNETDWRDPWGAARKAQQEMCDYATSLAITAAIEADAEAMRKIRMARADVREGKRLPRPRA